MTKDEETKSVASMNIYQKLAKIRKPVQVIQKNKQGFGYKYVTEEIILAKISGLMTQYSVSLIPEIVYDSAVVEPYSYTKTKVLKDGTIINENVNEIIVKSPINWVWVNDDNPDEMIVVPWYFVGQQADASQAFGSGLTYSSRYFLLKYFNIATSDDDPDRWRSIQKEAEELEGSEVAKAIVVKINDLCNQIMVDNPDERENVTKLIKTYARNGSGKATANYNDIKDPEIAGKLLHALEEKYSNKEKEE